MFQVIWTSANRQMLRLGTKWLQREPEWFRSYTVNSTLCLCSRLARPVSDADTNGVGRS